MNWNDLNSLIDLGGSMMGSTLVAVEIFGMGFVISFFIAVLIKVMLFTIRYFAGRSAKV